MRPPPLLLLVALAGVPGPTEAQRAETARFSLIPFVGGGTMGMRWESDDGETAMGPGSGIVLGGALDVRLGDTSTLEVLGSYTSSDYALDLGGERALGSGDISVFRTAASLLWRVRENVPGYFSLGAAAMYYSPGRKPGTEIIDENDQIQRVPLFDDQAQWMPGAHIGVGIDLQADEHTARFDLRLYGHRATEDVNNAFGGRLEPKLGLDLQGYLGYVIRF